MHLSVEVVLSPIRGRSATSVVRSSHDNPSLDTLLHGPWYDGGGHRNGEPETRPISLTRRPTQGCIRMLQKKRRTERKNQPLDHEKSIPTRLTINEPPKVNSKETNHHSEPRNVMMMLCSHAECEWVGAKSRKREPVQPNVGAFRVPRHRHKYVCMYAICARLKHAKRTRSARYFLLVKQQQQSILPAFCRLAPIVSTATNAVI